MKVQEPNVHADPLVSIIVTNYNYGNFLSNTIDSALGQCYQPLEVIVVDDGSTDDSQDVINGYGTRVQPIFKQNGGQASAMNSGFRQSRGEIVIFLDTDDMLLTGIVQSVVKAFQMQQNVTKVMYRMEVIDAKARLTGEIKPNPHLPLRSGDLSRQTLSFPFDMTDEASSLPSGDRAGKSSRALPAHREIWYQEKGGSGHEHTSREEPFYGTRYLPRKFKMASAIPPDNDVDVLAHDLGFARVHVGVLGDEKQREASLAALRSAAGFVRRELGRRLRIYHTPEIDFRYDKGLEATDRVARLLQEEAARAKPPDIGEDEGSGE